MSYFTAYFTPYFDAQQIEAYTAPPGNYWGVGYWGAGHWGAAYWALHGGVDATDALSATAIGIHLADAGIADADDTASGAVLALLGASAAITDETDSVAAEGTVAGEAGPVDASAEITDADDTLTAGATSGGLQSWGGVAVAHRPERVRVVQRHDQYDEFVIAIARIRDENDSTAATAELSWTEDDENVLQLLLAA